MTASALHPLAVLGKGDPTGCLQGYCRTRYGLLSLKPMLGEPHILNGDKTTVEWAFRCQDGTVFTVYDWKVSETPQGEYNWQIGGTERALEAFERFTGLKTSKTRL